MFLDFYKGTPILYLKHFHESENLECNFTGCSITEIIYQILEKTIFSSKSNRRRV
jgi:hypothetical protein